jgi:hypothetical protein
MLDLTQLTDALVDTFQRIQPLVAVLTDADPASIFAYVDSNPDRNSLSAALYEQPAGTVMVAWDDTGVNEPGDMMEWEHHFVFSCRAASGRSASELITLLVNGIPVPGDGQCWRRCGVMPGALPAEIIEIKRERDPEGIDYHEIRARIYETGDA